jgi:hypothetical protein
MTSYSKNPPFCIFEKKNCLQKLDNKKTRQNAVKVFEIG